ncbi:MAG: lipocalin [Gammaproteobacteria bacterium]|nr:lipocalin [Gammaproteobacteria bacterium]
MTRETRRLIFGLGALWLASSAAQGAAALATVANFQPAAYLGHWHQIALFPTRFQAQCLGDTTADYQPLPEQRLQVTNRCRTAQGYEEVVGVARPHPGYPANPAIMQVRFAPAWLAALPFVWGDYWVIATVGHYEAALVGSPDRQYLWLLARAPEVSDAVYTQLSGVAAQQGFDLRRLRRD